jgi:hypothetical protein
MANVLKVLHKKKALLAGAPTAIPRPGVSRSDPSALGL